MLKPFPTTKFLRDLKRVEKRGLNKKLLIEIVHLLENQTPLPPKNRDHLLTGNWRGYRECHIQPDWLLIYRIDAAANILYLVRTGTHNDLALA